MSQKLDLGGGLTMVIDGHLGGYIEGGDPATCYPDLWEWLVETLSVRLVLDVGCGDGVAMRSFDRFGAAAIGVDGVQQDDERILTHDFTIGPWPTPGSYFHPDFGHPGFDLVWSCEFVEHVAEPHVPNFLSAFKLGRYVAMTHAMPGQPGHHHVHCRERSYWTSIMNGVGFELDWKLTEAAREKAAINPDPNNHFARSGLVFVRLPV